MRPYEPTLYDQPIFWARFGQHSILDPLLPFMDSTDYAWRGCGVPDVAREMFSARQTVEDQISVKPGSFLLMISATSGNAFPADFAFQITDKATGLGISDSQLRYLAQTGGPGNLYPNQPLPLILPSPLVIQGILSVRITNLATANSQIRLFLQFAEPRR